jgi:hypothetical protein
MDAQARYDELVDDLVARNEDVETAKMMDMPCVKRGGTMVVGFSRDESAMVFKLPDAAQREAALSLRGAHLFDPMAGRPMKEWVVVPPDHASEWPRLAAAALAP